MMMFAVEGSTGKQYSLIGTTDSNPYLDLKDMEGKDIQVSDGYYMSSVMAMLEGVEAGDVITLSNPLTLEEYEIEIKGIVDQDMQSAVFTSRENVSKILGYEENISNIIMSDVELDIPDSKVSQIIKKADSKEQFDNVTNMMDVMIYCLIGIGAIICIAAIYVAVNMLVAENRSNISMLKVLGYKEKQINQIVLRVNHILLPIGILVSIPLVLASTNWFMVFLADFMGMLPKTYIAPKSFVYTIVLVCISYFGSLFFLRRKVAKVDMVESLKGNRE